MSKEREPEPYEGEVVAKLAKMLIGELREALENRPEYQQAETLTKGYAVPLRRFSIGDISYVVLQGRPRSNALALRSFLPGSQNECNILLNYDENEKNGKVRIKKSGEQMFAESDMARDKIEEVIAELSRP